MKQPYLLLLLIQQLASVNISAQEDLNQHRWLFGAQGGISIALEPHADWNSLDQFTVLDAINLAGKYEEVSQALGYEFWPSEQISKRVEPTIVHSLSLDRSFAKHWSVGFQFRYMEHRLFARQHLFPTVHRTFYEEAKLHTVVNLTEWALLFRRSFGHGNVQPFISAGAGITYWQQHAMRVQVSNFHFLSATQSKRHYVRPLLIGAGLMYSLHPRLQLRISADASLLMEKSKAPKVVQHGTLMVGLNYAL